MSSNNNQKKQQKSPFNAAMQAYESSIDDKLDELPYSGVFDRVSGPFKSKENNSLKSMAG